MALGVFIACWGCGGCCSGALCSIQVHLQDADYPDACTVASSVRPAWLNSDIISL